MGNSSPSGSPSRTASPAPGKSRLAKITRLWNGSDKLPPLPSCEKREPRKIERIEPVQNPENLNGRDIIIAVMGPTGAGKSTFIQTLTNKHEMEVGHSLQSQTQIVHALRIVFRDNFNVVLVDTPGFDDTNRTDMDILKTIARWFGSVKHSRIAGILYFHRITDNRITGTVLKNLDMFAKLCGRDFYRRVILVTTMWSECSAENEPELVTRLQDLKANYWQPMITQGSRDFRFRKTADSAWEIINHVVESLERSRSSELVKIHEELVQDGKKVPATEAGKRLHSRMQELVERQNGILEQLREELAKSADQEPMVIDLLLDDLSKLRKERERAMADMAALESIMERFRRQWRDLVHPV